MKNKTIETHEFGAPKNALKLLTTLVKEKQMTEEEASDYIASYVFSLANEILSKKVINQSIIAGYAREITNNWFESIDMVNKKLLQSDDEIIEFIETEYKRLKSPKCKKERENKIAEIKKKDIKDMSVEELLFIIENDESLISVERLKYTTQLLTKSENE